VRLRAEAAGEHAKAPAKVQRGEDHGAFVHAETPVLRVRPGATQRRRCDARGGGAGLRGRPGYLVRPRGGIGQVTCKRGVGYLSEEVVEERADYGPREAPEHPLPKHLPTKYAFQSISNMPRLHPAAFPAR
jgi:hypothetical protein